VIAGNWKMNHGPRAAGAYVGSFLPLLGGVRSQVLLFPPALSLPAARAALGEDRGSLALGIQQIHDHPSGAFTGELSAEMAVEAGATYALVGHSERRALFRESDAEVALRFRAALRAGLQPVLCVGETLEERQGGGVEEVLGRQLDAVLGPRSSPSAEFLPPFLVAYEPVWAIGTGVHAEPEDAEAAHAFLRARIALRLGDTRSAEVPILYGGSVTPENAQALLAREGVDGLLVGGASLNPVSFAEIVRIAG